MPCEDEPVIGGLFRVAEVLEAEPTVRFETVYEERPESVPEPSPTRLAMTRLLCAGPANWHGGGDTRH